MTRTHVAAVVFFGMLSALNVRASSAQSQGTDSTTTQTIGQWLKVCESLPDDGYPATDAQVFCTGYFTGLTDALIVTSVATGKNLGCVPEQATPLQLMRVVHKYVKDHPEELHLRREVVIFKALRSAFCPAQKP